MARRIMVFATAGVALCAYFIFFKERQDLIYLLSASLLILVVTYVFQYQIDQLMIRGVPQALDTDMRNMLLATSKHFKEMPVPNKKMAEDRMVRWVMKKDFINKNEQKAPEDVKYMLSWYAILLTMHQKTFLYEEVDRIVFYHHPFLSPGYPDDVHIAEVEREDGTMIISVPHLIKGHMEKGMYNIALHAMAEAYAVCFMKEKISWPDDIWEQLERISTIPKSSIDAYVGLPVEDPWPVAVHHQLMYRNANIPEVLHQLPQLLAPGNRS
jgi:hypothetical protein